MSKNEIKPSEVRERVLKEHAKLRESIAEVRAAKPGADLRKAMRTLLDVLMDHLESEDKILLPTLESIDAWGPERVKRINDEHKRQREMVAKARVGLDEENADADALLKNVDGFLATLEADMEFEERTDLSAELLSEFPIQSDFGGS